MSIIDFLKSLFKFENFILLESVIMITVFLCLGHGKSILSGKSIIAKLFKGIDDKAAYKIHFVSVFVLFFLVPVITILLYKKNPMDFGLQLGDWRKGLLWVGAMVPLVFLAGLVSSRQSDMQKQYPFSKKSMENRKSFVIQETIYFFFYYSGWEFLFRGVILFALVPISPVLAVVVQVIPSALLHIGHPESEMWSSVFMGLVFGYIALSTGSILYPFLIHAAMGISLDIWIYNRTRSQ